MIKSHHSLFPSARSLSKTIVNMAADSEHGTAEKQELSEQDSTEDTKSPSNNVLMKHVKVSIAPVNICLLFYG